MSNCVKCNSILSDNVEVCPICGATQNLGDAANVDNIDRKLSSTPSLLVSGTSASTDDNANNEMELERLIKRGDECFNSGKKWLGAKDRSGRERNSKGRSIIMIRPSSYNQTMIGYLSYGLNACLKWHRYYF